MRLRDLLLAATLLAGIGAAPPLALAADHAGARCSAGLGLLVDRSGSLDDYDHGAPLRRAVAAALDRSRPAGGGDLVATFASGQLHTAAPTGVGWTAALAGLLDGADGGSTELDGTLDEAARLQPQRWIVVSDREVVLAAQRPALAALVTIGGLPGAMTMATVQHGGGVVRAVGDAATAAAVIGELCGSSGAPLSGTARAGDDSAGKIVLVSGLRTSTAELRGVRTQAACRRSAAMGAWCSALVASGWRVWVPSAAPGGRGGALLNTTGALDANAAALRDWLRRRVPGSPVLAGHSMGGLIAHAAIVRGASAAALLTVGTPHAGSYGADAYLAAVAAARGCALLCPITGAQLAVAAAIVRHRFGAALDDLTRARRLRQAPLGPPGVPLATWAGTPNRLPALALGLSAVGGGGGYVVPNDGIVGVGSATGRLAGLSPAVVVDDGAARHSSSVPPRSAQTELASPTVSRWIVQQAAAFTDPAATRLRTVARSVVPRRSIPVWRLAHAAGATRRHLRRVSVPMVPLLPLVPGGAPVAVTAEAVVVATGPPALRCDGTPIEATEVAAGLWFADTGALGCRTVSADASDTGVLGRAAGATLLGAQGAGGAVAATVQLTRRRHGGWSVLLRGPAAARPTLQRGGRRVALRRLRGTQGGERRWRASLGARGTRQIVARMQHPDRSVLVAGAVLP
ncbi:MAG: hypothetical protein QM679_11230 [Patulibacter sp.]